MQGEGARENGVSAKGKLNGTNVFLIDHQGCGLGCFSIGSTIWLTVRIRIRSELTEKLVCLCTRSSYHPRPLAKETCWCSSGLSHTNSPDCEHDDILVEFLSICAKMPVPIPQVIEGLFAIGIGRARYKRHGREAEGTQRGGTIDSRRGQA